MLQFWIWFSCTFGCAICSTKCKSYEYSCFIFCFVHLMKDYFSYHCEEIWGRCLLFWSVLSWFWLFWSHYLSWALFFLNSSPLQYGISFNYKLTRTSWWGPLWENNRLLPTSPPKKSDPLPPAIGNKHWITLKKQNTLFFSSQKCKQFRSITQQTLIKSHKKFIHPN